MGSRSPQSSGPSTLRFLANQAHEKHTSARAVREILTLGGQVEASPDIERSRGRRPDVNGGSLKSGMGLETKLVLVDVQWFMRDLWARGRAAPRGR